MVYDKSGINQRGRPSPAMFRKMLCDLKTYLRVSHGVVLNDTEILVHLLWADDMVIMSSTLHGFSGTAEWLISVL